MQKARTSTFIVLKRQLEVGRHATRIGWLRNRGVVGHRVQVVVGTKGWKGGGQYIISSSLRHRLAMVASNGALTWNVHTLRDRGMVFESLFATGRRTSKLCRKISQTSWQYLIGVYYNSPPAKNRPSRPFTRNRIHTPPKSEEEGGYSPPINPPVCRLSWLPKSDSSNAESAISILDTRLREAGSCPLEGIEGSSVVVVATVVVMWGLVKWSKFHCTIVP